MMQTLPSQDPPLKLPCTLCRISHHRSAREGIIKRILPSGFSSSRAVFPIQFECLSDAIYPSNVGWGRGTGGARCKLHKLQTKISRAACVDRECEKTFKTMDVSCVRQPETKMLYSRIPPTRIQGREAPIQVVGWKEDSFSRKLVFIKFKFVFEDEIYSLYYKTLQMKLQFLLIVRYLLGKIKISFKLVSPTITNNTNILWKIWSPNSTL